MSGNTESPIFTENSSLPLHMLVMESSLLQQSPGEGKPDKNDVAEQFNTEEALRDKVVDPLTSVKCYHFIQLPKKGYLCLPPVVQGETLGLFYLKAPKGMSDEPSISQEQLVVTVGEGIKLSLSNLRLREIMREQATHDPLTGLFNLRYLDDTLPRELNHAQRRDIQISIAMLDIDHFKRVNDTFRHEAGDLLLHELGRVLHENIRKSDIACRYGGEEFVLVWLDSPQEASYQHLERIRSHIKDLRCVMEINYSVQ